MKTKTLVTLCFRWKTRLRFPQAGVVVIISDTIIDSSKLVVVIIIIVIIIIIDSPKQVAQLCRFPLYFSIGKIWNPPLATTKMVKVLYIYMMGVWAPLF